MMNDCADGDMRDRLPDYVHGKLSAAARSAVAGHLAACAECAAEVGLIEAVSRAFAAPRVNVAGIVAALPAAPVRGSRRTGWGVASRIAAAIGIVAIGAFSAVAVRNWERAPGRRASAETAPSPAVLAAAPAPARPAVTSADSPAVRKRAEVSIAQSRPAISFGGGLSDLSDDQLDTLLGELDGLDALPSVEPETHLTPILPPNDGGHGAR
jgi:anti-sigma factor RsiW